MKRVLLAAIGCVLVVGLVGVGYVRVTGYTRSPEKALDQARSYEPDSGVACGAALTRAYHKGTGVEYIFSSTCLPPGWVEATPAPGEFTTSQEEALRAAQEYRPIYVCGQALTEAYHPLSGARYTFPSTCLAPGWVEEEKASQ